MTWDDFDTPTSPTTQTQTAEAPQASEPDLSDFDAALGLDDFTAEQFPAPEPERPEQDDSRLPPPFSVDGVDLLTPPGFVGDVAAWIDSQCRYPRRRLAVASAIVSVGNIGGLSHDDALDGVTSNMLAFCVAASATGKEAVQQAMADLHRACDLHGGLQGAIKSDKEILENIIEHQAAFYVIDEIGIFLTKVKNAQKRGGATYLEGVFGTIMSAYSKANSRFLLGGREKRDLRKQYAQQVARSEDDGLEDDHARKMLTMIDSGLERPFLSLIGYTTPSTFDSVMDGEAATQGFVGRAIIVSEPDINPEAREDFVKRPLPSGLAMRLIQLCHGGSFDAHGAGYRRIEHYGERVSVYTEPEAAQMLRDVNRWLHRYAEDMGEQTGEASVAMVRRSYEMIAKVSYILAIATRTRTAEHVRWAFAYVRKELDAKIALVFANDNSRNRPLESMAARILSYIDSEKGTSASVIANRMKTDQEKVEAMLETLEQAGAVYSEAGRKYKGKVVRVWKVREE